MKLGHYARLAARESRRSRGRITLFMGCIAVGVAAVVLGELDDAPGLVLFGGLLLLGTVALTVRTALSD